MLLTLLLMIPAAIIGAGLVYRRPNDFWLFAMAAGIFCLAPMPRDSTSRICLLFGSACSAC